MTSRRELLLQTAAATAGAALKTNRVSLAEWSLVRSLFGGRIKNAEFPRITREEFGLEGVEYVNQFFENPMMPYLQKLRNSQTQHGVTAVRIMVDDEGNMAAVDRRERMDAAVAHRRWVDIAHYLGCTDIRCNMRGGLPDWKQDKDLVARAAESFRDLLEYSAGSGLNIIIENHGGASSNPDLLVSLMKTVGHQRFGLLPDFGNVNPGDDHEAVIRKLAPYAKGVSVKASWNEAGENRGWDIARLMGICKDAGFQGWWGIECSYGPRPAQKASLSPEQIWENEKKGVHLTKAAIANALKTA